MTVHELALADARRIAVRAQLLDGARPDGLLETVRRLTVLQVDPVSAIAPNAELVPWSRLGSAYQPAGLADALAVLLAFPLRGAALGEGQCSLARVGRGEHRRGDRALLGERLLG